MNMIVADNRERRVAEQRRLLRQKVEEKRASQFHDEVALTEDNPARPSHIVEEIFWEVHYEEECSRFDSDAFTFAGLAWRLTLIADSKNAFSIRISSLSRAIESWVQCEFRIHCGLKPALTYQIRQVLHFSTSTDTQFNGLRNFLARRELLQYLNAEGKLSISVVMKTKVDENGNFINFTV